MAFSSISVSFWGICVKIQIFNPAILSGFIKVSAVLRIFKCPMSEKKLTIKCVCVYM